MQRIGRRVKGYSSTLTHENMTKQLTLYISNKLSAKYFWSQSVHYRNNRNKVPGSIALPYKSLRSHVH